MPSKQYTFWRGTAEFFPFLRLPDKCSLLHSVETYRVLRKKKEEKKYNTKSAVNMQTLTGRQLVFLFLPAFHTVCVCVYMCLSACLQANGLCV